MFQPIYDKITKENVNGEIKEYGLVYRNEKIVSIKTGADGNILPLLQQLDCDNLEILTVEGADHNFTGMAEACIALTNLL